MTTGAILNQSESVEWYTPACYAEAARNVLGSIDLDPASCIEANRVIKARYFYTQEMLDNSSKITRFTFDHGQAFRANGMPYPWQCVKTVFLNPHYGRDSQRAWSAKLLAEHQSGNVGAAILLVNACTSEQWFAPLWRFPICFTDHRIKFNSPGVSGDAPGVNGNGRAAHEGPSAPVATSKRGPTKGSAFIFLPDLLEFRLAIEPERCGNAVDAWHSHPSIASFVGEFSKFGFIYLPNAVALAMRDLHKSKSEKGKVAW